MQLRDWFFGLFGRRARTEDAGAVADTQKRETHVIILDGTMSSLDPGYETNAGLTFKLLSEIGSDRNLTVYYEAGIQWRDWSGTWGVMTGKGINRQIERAYGVLASRYNPGDRIVLIGYSRGAFAVRSLAGVIDMVGLVKSENATTRTVRQAYRHYKIGADRPSTRVFRENYCHASVAVEAVAVWDTVKALGLRLPIIWRWAQQQHNFHNHCLGDHIKNGFHALAIHERRQSYAPVMWTRPEGWAGHMEQVWFRGNHADVGGQVWSHPRARPLANIPLVWMLERLSSCGLPLPDGWQGRFHQDISAPSTGNWHGWSKVFLSRRKRVIGKDRSERMHESVTGDISQDATRSHKKSSVG